jgi:hypothetical protein
MEYRDTWDKKSMQSMTLMTVAVIAGVYCLFTFLLPFIQYKLRQEANRRDILNRLEEKVAEVNFNSETNNISVRNATPNEDTQQQIIPPNHSLANSKFKLPTIHKTKNRNSERSLSKSTNPSEVSINETNNDKTPNRSQFLPQFPNLPISSDGSNSTSNLIDSRQRGLIEARRRMIEQQDREYELSVKAEQEKQREMEKRQHQRQTLFDSLKAEPDQTISKEEVVTFGFRAKQLSVKSDELGKPFKSSRRFLRSQQWKDVINYVRSLELRPIDASFTIVANGTNQQFRLCFPGPHDEGDIAVEESVNSQDMGVSHQALIGDSAVPSNTVLWIHYT